MPNDATATNTSAILSVNGLNYGANDTSMAVVSSRKFKSFYSLAQSYQNGQILQFVLSSGAEYLNARNSYIKFTMTPKWTAEGNIGSTASFGVGKACTNLIREMVMVHSSGAEVDRCQDFATWTNHKRLWTRGSDWLQSIGSCMGIESPYKTASVVVEDRAKLGYPTDATVTFAVDNTSVGGTTITIAQVGPTALPLGVWEIGDVINIQGDTYTVQLVTTQTGTQHELTVSPGKTLDIPDLAVAKVVAFSRQRSEQDVNTFKSGQTYDFILPLCEVSDIFDQNGQLLPNYLVAGSRLDLTLADPSQAFVLGAIDPAQALLPTEGAIPSFSYTITKAEIVLDLYTLVDSVLRQLAAISASSGLSIDFSGIWTNKATHTDGTPSVNISKALSQANATHVVLRDNSKLTRSRTSFARDSIDTLPYEDNVSSWQFVLGSQFMPQQPVTTLQESFFQSQVAWMRLDQALPNTVDLNSKYNGEPDEQANDLYNKTDPHTGLISLSMERNAMLTNSGQAISAQRGLQFVFNLGNARPAVTSSTIFIDYLRLVDIFTDQITVRL
jgi:hypothetical protein